MQPLIAVFQLALLWSLFGVLGGLLGRRKGRTSDGALLGLLLGPAGIVIAWIVLPEKQPQRTGPRITTDDAVAAPGSAERSSTSGK